MLLAGWLAILAMPTAQCIGMENCGPRGEDVKECNNAELTDKNLALTYIIINYSED